MARLTASQRRHMPDSEFALPGHRYPMNDKVHQTQALRMVAAHGTPEEKKKVRAAVARKRGRTAATNY